MTTVDHVIEIVGGIVTLLSLLSSFVNHVIRTKQANGAVVSNLLLGTGTVLNIGSANLDKAIQLAKQLRGAPPAAPKE